MKRFFVFASLFLFFFLTPFAMAHQPYLILGEKQILVTDPEISKAYYGEFSGSPAVFTIHENKPFKFYVGVLVSDQFSASTDVSAKISKDSIPFAFLNAASAKWNRFYEPFGGDLYYQGPEFRADASSGTYTIEVSRPGNFGKYVLAVGETESFTISETVRTLKILPALKSEFFEKPVWTAYFNRIGLYLFIALIGLFISLLFVLYFGKKLFSIFRKK